MGARGAWSRGAGSSLLVSLGEPSCGESEDSLEEASEVPKDLEGVEKEALAHNDIVFLCV